MVVFVLADQFGEVGCMGFALFKSKAADVPKSIF